MNELAGLVVFCYAEELQLVEKVQSSAGASLELKLFARAQVNAPSMEADVFWLFSRVMAAGQWEMFILTPTKGLNQAFNLTSNKVNPLVQRVNRLKNSLLKSVDAELFRYMKLLNVEFELFLHRWIKCMLTREFALPDSAKL